MLRLGILLLTLSACASPSPRFIGAERSEISVEEMTFTVFRRGSEVEVYRTGFAPLPRQRDVFTGAITAIEAATQCSVRPRSMTGDAALIRASIDCP